MTLFSQHAARAGRSWENCNGSHTFYISHQDQKQCCDAVILKCTVQFHFLQRGKGKKIDAEKKKKNQLSRASHLQVHTEMNIFFNSRLAMGSGGPETMLMDGVLMLLNVIFFSLNRQNYKFLLHCQWSCPMHKSVARPRRPWIIASHGRCYFAETNSSDKICRRLIVYSCFMAQCNLNTFMISLKSLHEANACARLRQQEESQALFLHLDSSPPSYSLLPLCKLMEAAWIFIVWGAAAFRPLNPFILSVLLSFFLSLLPSFFPSTRANYSDLCKWVASVSQPSWVEIESDPMWPSAINRAKLQWMHNPDQGPRLKMSP